MYQGLVLSGAGAQFDPLEQSCEGIDASDDANAICEASGSGTGTDPITSDNGIIADIANILTFVAAIIAVFIIVIAGITMMTSGGDSGKVTSSRNAIIYTVIGLVIIVLARTIVIFVFDNLIT
jgi:type IV secretory pathway VirB2 component (pilin)